MACTLASSRALQRAYAMLFMLTRKIVVSVARKDGRIDGRMDGWKEGKKDGNKQASKWDLRTILVGTSREIEQCLRLQKCSLLTRNCV